MKASAYKAIKKPFTRFKHRSIARLITRFPTFGERFIRNYTPWESQDIPWTQIVTPLEHAHLAVVTTSGVHHPSQRPFDMFDPNGDPTFRLIDRQRILQDYTITHDYYDHSNADRDLNIVFPLERLLELESEGRIGCVADTHYSFMGHIDGPHIYALITSHARDIAEHMRESGIDIALFTPG